MRVPQKTDDGIYNVDTITPPVQAVSDTDKWLRGINTALSNPGVQQLLIGAANYLFAKAQPAEKKSGVKSSITGEGDSQMLFEGKP